MNNDKLSVDLSQQELGVIESALRTQEKILSVQSRGELDGSARTRLTELQQVLRTLDIQTGLAPRTQCQGWSGMARGLFG